MFIKKLTIKSIAGLSIASFLSACGGNSEDDQIRSDSVSTGQIFATFQVISDGDSHVYAEAQFTRGVPPSGAVADGDFITLVGDDELWLSAGPDIESVAIEGNLFEAFRDLEDTQKEFRQSRSQRESYDFLFSRVIINVLGDWYSATLPQSNDREYRLALFRDEHIGSDARNNVVTLPQTFELTAPIASNTYSRSSDDIVISWNDIDPQASVEIEAITTCSDFFIDSYEAETLIDDGSITISAGDIANSDLNGTCSTTINVRKIRIGNFDSRFIGGVASGYQIRRAVISTTD
ncbi:MAG: hypothetical protein K6L76_07665 [Agarilytica sp.]